jgi:hypothetical protein
MKKIYWFISAIALHLNIQAQRRPTDRIVTGPVVVLEEQKVALYENVNYTGTAKMLAPGQYILSDFNDMASSIKVPQSMVAYIYEHAASDKGYGMSTDILEDVPDLSVYNFNDKISYISVFYAVKENMFDWARGAMVNGQFIAGHWERKRANGKKPDNFPPAVVSTIPEVFDPNDIGNAPVASQAEIDEFSNIQKNQLGVAVLGGETTKSFYYHHNKPGEEVYKYDKVIDASKLPAGLIAEASKKLGDAGIILKPLEAATDLLGDLGQDIIDFFGGSGSTMKKLDTWYPVSEFKRTVCGKMKEDAFICGQDYLHTQVTVDKDVCMNLTPSENFRSFLTNRWTGETTDHIEGEVKSVNLSNFNTQTGKTTETTTPRNPMLLQIKKDENVCLFGPWMGDILDLNLNVPVPLTAKKVELADIDMRKNNEIHPVNQLWKRKGKEILLTAIVDGTGYFQKIGNGEIAASGLYQRMRFYIAFLLPGNTGGRVLPSTAEFDINGIGFDFTTSPISGTIQPETLILKQNGVVRIKVNDNSVLRNQRTHKVFFDKVRKRANGTVQGYIVVETEPINKQGGSINIIVKNLTNIPDLPVLTEQ